VCASMGDIQSATAEIRRGKKKKIKKIEDRNHRAQGKNIMSASDTQGGNNNDWLASGFYMVSASSSGRQANFAALNRGRHLCSTGRPSG